MGCLFLSLTLAAQQPRIQVLESGKKISLRGLSVVNDQVIWASGSQGSVTRSLDGGKTFTWITVPGYEKIDFRDIEAWDANTALIMGITEPAVILKTKDGGKNWRKVFEDTTRGAFLDAMDFTDARHGIVLGDPIGQAIFTATTADGGDSWQPLDREQAVSSHKGEAFFASSGTNIHLLDKKFRFLLVSGGMHSRFFYPDTVKILPLLQGAQSTGANSLAVYKKKEAFVVGGDFTKDSIGTQNSVRVDLKTPEPVFHIPQTPPHGYRSCVIYLSRSTLLSCGTSGVDLSQDGGNNWELISQESYHVCQKARKGTAVFLAGANGRIARLTLP